MKQSLNNISVILLCLLACVGSGGCNSRVSDERLSPESQESSSNANAGAPTFSPPSTDDTATKGPETSTPLEHERNQPSRQGDQSDRDALPLAVEFADHKPVLRPGMLFIPTLVLKSAETSGGVIFAAQTPVSKRPVLLSAMHLFGPATGMDEQLTVDEISETWLGVVATDVVKREKASFSGLGLGLPGASAEFEPSGAGDVMAFYPKEHQDLNPISLSPADPEEGDGLWLLSPNLTNDSFVHRVVCVGVAHECFLVYQFDESINLSGTSGAPVINEQGLIVAVHRGGGTQEGKTFGTGTLASRFLPILVRELQAKSILSKPADRLDPEETR
jgi:hypothetical protein